MDAVVEKLLKIQELLQQVLTEMGSSEELKELSEEPPRRQSPARRADRPAAKDRSSRYLPLAKELAKVVRLKRRIKVTAGRLRSWADDIRKLIEHDLAGEDAEERVRSLIEWYGRHIGEKFVPVVDSAYSLRRKFISLEEAALRSGDYELPSKAPAKEPTELLKEFFAHRSEDPEVAAEDFYREVFELALARAPRELSDYEQRKLAEILLKLYEAIEREQERSGFRPGQAYKLFSPTELIKAYLERLPVEQIDPTSEKVFDIRSGWFQNFCRAYAQEAYGEPDLHPLFGKDGKRIGGRAGRVRAS